MREAFSRPSLCRARNRFAVVASTLALIVGAFTVVHAEAATIITGVDVSRWDHSATTAYPKGTPIDWVKVKAAGRSFAIVKASENTNYRSPYFVSDYQQARAAGLVVGSYHFARPALPLSTATDQAKYYVSSVLQAGAFNARDSFPPILDLEVTGGLSRSNLIAWTQQFLTTSRALTGRTPILYTYDSFVRNTMGNTKLFTSYPLWYARYSSIVPTSATLPGGWNQWTMWQYTSTETTNGIIGKGDVSRWNGTISALHIFADGRKTGYAPPSAPNNPVVTPGVASATLNWELPTDEGGVVVNRYRVSIDSGLETVTPSTSFVAIALTPGNHTYSISAENVAGIGQAVTGTFTMPPFDANATITPVALTLTSVNAPTGSALTSNVVQVQLSRADTGQAINGATVKILVRPELGTVWTTAVITTDVEGVGTTTFKAPVDASITATTQAGVWYNASRARSYIRIKPALSAVLSTVSVKRTGLVKLRGGTTALLAGQKIYRQVYAGGRWNTVASATISPSGRYVFTVPTNTKGVKKVRAFLPLTPRHLAVGSRTVVLTVR